MKPPAVIRVTADHITRGKPRSAYDCPIALAATEQFNELDDAGYRVAVVDGLNVFAAGCWVLGADLPAEAAEFVGAYDEGAADYVAPFEFDVEWHDGIGEGA